MRLKKNKDYESYIFEIDLEYDVEESIINGYVYESITAEFFMKLLDRNREV